MVPIKAYAKINLGLRILRKRPDGYHDLETVFHRIALHDEITLNEAPSLSFHLTNADLQLGENNLCLRAAKLLQETCTVPNGAAITLTKHIPIGAGLGGGSADAAAVLRGLQQLWQLRVDEETMRSMAVRLGSDVPYFLHPGTAYATGRGEMLEYFTLDIPFWILVVYPDLHVSTAWAYEHLGRPGRLRPESLKTIVPEYIGNAGRLSRNVYNDFEPVVFGTHEKVVHTRKALYKAGAVFAQMSGSGSSLYGFFRQKETAEQAAMTFPANYVVSLTPPHFQPETEETATPPAVTD